MVSLHENDNASLVHKDLYYDEAYPDDWSTMKIRKGLTEGEDYKIITELEWNQTHKKHLFAIRLDVVYISTSSWTTLDHGNPNVDTSPIYVSLIQETGALDNILVSKW